MSSCDGISRLAQTNAAHLICDGAATDDDGRIQFVASKATLFPHLNLAIAVTGYVHPHWLSDDMAAAAPADQIDAVQLLPVLAHSIAGRNRMIDVPVSEVKLIAVS